MQPSVISNFISPATCNILNNYFRQKVSLNQRDMLSITFVNKNHEFSFNHNDLSEGDINSDIVKLIIESVAHQFNYNKDKISLNRINYQVLVEGQEIGYHTDNDGAYEGQMKNIGKSALLYLNDDYEGGEILFYDNIEDTSQYFSYKPYSGTLIYFTGNDHHPHSVNKVLKGERANLVLFYDVDES